MGHCLLARYVMNRCSEAICILPRCQQTWVWWTNNIFPQKVVIFIIMLDTILLSMWCLDWSRCGSRLLASMSSWASSFCIIPHRKVLQHDDVIKWKHFQRYWSFVRGINRSPVDSPHKGQWRRALTFSWCAPEQTVELTIEMPVIWDAMAFIVT